ncbi:transglutaminase-like domain-containing protein [Yoonia sp. 2307UL14-13]|uniref:transglutaminase-like domain-containing protein n=1 Tax=Yoonia sp. 2307UL14-13 TaxID=3126506 RepID=UPI0030A82A69
MLINDAAASHRIAAEDDVGHRYWTLQVDGLQCVYDARIEIWRERIDLMLLEAVPLQRIPAPVVKYLMPSRYCHPEVFFDFTAQTFGALSGGALIQAMSDWIAGNFIYDPLATHPTTTATDSFRDRRGVCRDYAQTLIAMVRAVGIPARIVSAYAPHAEPPDFHALVEVYLDDTWHMIDPTGMSRPDEVALIGVGRDAADIAFMTSFGLVEMKNQAVSVVEHQGN